MSQFTTGGGAYVYGVPAILEHNPDAAFSGLTMTMTGWDGIKRSLTDPSTGLLLTSDGVVGLLTAPGDRFTTESPAVAGSRYRGSRTLERPVKWPLHVYSDTSSLHWIELDRALHRVLRRDSTIEWAVTQTPSNETRVLVVRFVDEEPTLKVDPTKAGWASYEVALVAEDPYWRGDPITRPFGAGTEAPFYPVGGGPPFTISEGSTLASGSIDNPGDVKAWPVWTITGPTSAVTVGVGDSLVGVYGDLDADDVLVIDTDPRRQSATLNGVRVRGVLAPHDFAPIPARGVSPLSIAMVGTGTVECTIVPRYERAW